MTDEQVFATLVSAALEVVDTGLDLMDEIEDHNWDVVTQDARIMRNLLNALESAADDAQNTLRVGS